MLMKKFDTSKWGEFRLIDILKWETQKEINPRLILNSIDGEEQYAFIGQSSVNNGLISYVNIGKEMLNNIESKPLLLIHSNNHVVVYVDKPFYLKDGHGATSVLSSENLNEKNAMFPISVLNSSLDRVFDYDMKATKIMLKNHKIKLPVTESGKVDWEYMEEYIEKLEGKVTASLIVLDRAKHIPKKKADFSDWKDFGVVDFFDLSLPKGDIQVKGLDDGDIALITPSNTNNGLIQRIPRNSESTLYDAGCLTVDMFGNAYYHEEDFFVTAHGHVNVLIPKISISKGVGLFIATAIKSMFIQKYGFKDMCTQKVLKREMIKLPITSDGVPDWNYMEQYMERLQKKAEQLITCFG